MEPREVLEALVAVVATLGQLVATVTAPRRRAWPLLYPESLHADLRKFIWTLWDTLDHCDVTSLCQRGVTPLGQALAALKVKPGATWADFTGVGRAWLESVDVLRESWAELYRDANNLLSTFEGEDTDDDADEADKDNDQDTDEDTDEDTATGLARDLQDENPPSWGTAGDSLVAAAQQPSVALPSAVAVHDDPVAVASEAREEAMVATRQAGAATRRGQRVKEAQELLERLINACYDVDLFPWGLEGCISEIEVIEDGTEEACLDVLEDLVADVATFEELWEASARLTARHLLVALGEIDFLLSSPYGGSGGPGGPRGRVVAELCQKAIEDIPRLLGGQ